MEVGDSSNIGISVLLVGSRVLNPHSTAAISGPVYINLDKSLNGRTKTTGFNGNLENNQHLLFVSFKYISHPQRLVV